MNSSLGYPLPPPNGHPSWLDYAVATMDTRRIFNDHLWEDKASWSKDTTTDDFRAAALAELAQLRADPLADCPGIERVNGIWFFTGTKIPVTMLFDIFYLGTLTLEQWRMRVGPEIPMKHILAVVSCVHATLRIKWHESQNGSAAATDEP